MFKRGVGVSVLSQYLQEANREVEVWLQVKGGGRGEGSVVGGWEGSTYAGELWRLDALLS